MRSTAILLAFFASSLVVAQQLPSKPDPSKATQESPAQEESKAKTPLAPPDAAEKAADYSQQAFVIQKYLTRIRFENNGTSQREQIMRIRVQTQAGVQEF